MGQRQADAGRPARGIQRRTSLGWKRRPPSARYAPRTPRGASRACGYEARQRAPHFSRENRAPRAESPRQAESAARAVVQRSSHRQGRPRPRRARAGARTHCCRNTDAVRRDFRRPLPFASSPCLRGPACGNA